MFNIFANLIMGEKTRNREILKILDSNSHVAIIKFGKEKEIIEGCKLGRVTSQLDMA